MTNLILKYSLFALIAISGNLLVQYAVFQNYDGPFQLLLAMTFGTVTSLFIKYFLDKKFIFYFKSKKNNIYNFVLYSINGVFTTLIFWTIETAFYLLSSVEIVRYMAAFIALCLCYVIKYHLDKRIVFAKFPNDNLFQFEEIEDIFGMTIFLDIDGTLVPDNCFEIDNNTILKVEKLKRTNTIYLCTNSQNRFRNNKFTKILGLKIASLKHKKPSKNIILEVQIKNPKQILVIGDKFLTDGLFAKRIDAEFLMVKRKLSLNETLYVKVVNFIDNLIFRFSYLLKNN